MRGSDALSVLSQTTYFTNQIETLVGHAAARQVACNEELVKETLDRGCRLITHEHRDWVTKPFRWMYMRRYPVEKIQRRFLGKETARVGEQSDYVWHVVVCECRRSTPNAKPQVCTTYFWSSMSIFYDAVRDQFEMLECVEDDDPQIIETAMQNKFFTQLLERFFRSGDTKCPKFFKTLAMQPIYNGSSLLLLCCERGYVECVKLLLNKYSTKTASKEWLQLADPLWWEKKFGNCAFTVAAYRGNLKLFRILWQWAEKHQCVQAVEQFQTRKGENLIQCLQRRLEFAEAHPDALDQPIDNFREIWNLISPTFGAPLKTVSKSEVDIEKVKSLIFLDYECNQSERMSIPIPPCVTLGECATRFLDYPLDNAKVVILNAHIADSIQDDAERFFETLRTCRRISFTKCTCSPEIATLLCECATKQFRLGTNWTSLDLGTVVLDCADVAWDRFEDALESFLSATLDTFGDSDFFGLMFGHCAGRYIPRSLSGLFGVAWLMKKVLYSLLDDSNNETSKQIALSQEFSPHNPFFAVCAYVQRHCLRKSELMNSDSITDVLDPSWKEYVRRVCDMWLTQLPLLSKWSCRMLPDAAPFIPLIHRLVDEAIVYLLKMRPSKERVGIDIVPVICEALRAHDAWEQLIPKTAEYMHRKRLYTATA